MGSTSSHVKLKKTERKTERKRNCCLSKSNRSRKTTKIIEIHKKWSKIIIVVDKINYKTLVVFLAAGIG